MAKVFNVTGDCKPELHYMVNIEKRLKEIKELIDAGKYFTINRARQYGKTTTLRALKYFLKEEYLVVSLDFQKIGNAKFRNENVFSLAFARLFLRAIRRDEDEISENMGQILDMLADLVRDGSTALDLLELFEYLSDICKSSSKPVVLMIDEVDSATNNQVFLDFLAQLRGYYIDRDETPTFQSVILAGVYDVRNLKRKLRSEEEHKVNSPWNVAVDFTVDMDFSMEDIIGMLAEYEHDYQTGMDIEEMARLLYEYTSGYPFMVSRLCQILDEELVDKEGVVDKAAAWTKAGFLQAVKMILDEKNTLFESLTNKLIEYPQLREMLCSILFVGEKVSYNYYNPIINLATVLGFVKNNGGMLMIANRIFETCLYNLFLSEEELNNRIYTAGAMDKNQFIQNGELNMELVLKRFMVCWDDLYHAADERFVEENGRKFFLLYLKPIINGVGNYYIESRTRDNGRTDVIVDYRGRQYIVEIKVWRGEEYNKRGEEQLVGYLNAYHAQKGYLLSFNFNKRKTIGAREIQCAGKTIFEVVV